MDLTFSRHARRQMRSRGISEAQARNVVAGGESWPSRQGRTAYQLNRVRVIIGAEGQVVTCYRVRPRLPKRR